MSAQSELKELSNIRGYRMYKSGKNVYLVSPSGELLRVQVMPKGIHAHIQLASAFQQIVEIHREMIGEGDE